MLGNYSCWSKQLEAVKWIFPVQYWRVYWDAVECLRYYVQIKANYILSWILLLSFSLAVLNSFHVIWQYNFESSIYFFSCCKIQSRSRFQHKVKVQMCTYIIQSHWVFSFLPNLCHGPPLLKKKLGKVSLISVLCVGTDCVPWLNAFLS